MSDQCAKEDSVNSVTFAFETTAPLFLHGASGTLEFRTPSVRGKIRYWARALLGARLQDIAKIKRQQSFLLGSTALGSAITLRVNSSGNPSIGKHPTQCQVTIIT